MERKEKKKRTDDKLEEIDRNYCKRDGRERERERERERPN